MCVLVTFSDGGERDALLRLHTNHLQSHQLPVYPQQATFRANKAKDTLNIFVFSAGRSIHILCWSKRTHSVVNKYKSCLYFLCSRWNGWRQLDGDWPADSFVDRGVGAFTQFLQTHVGMSCSKLKTWFLNRGPTYTTVCLFIPTTWFYWPAIKWLTGVTFFWPRWSGPGSFSLP